MEVEKDRGEGRQEGKFHAEDAEGRQGRVSHGGLKRGKGGEGRGFTRRRGDVEMRRGRQGNQVFG